MGVTTAPSQNDTTPSPQKKRKKNESNSILFWMDLSEFSGENRTMGGWEDGDIYIYIYIYIYIHTYIHIYSLWGLAHRLWRSRSLTICHRQTGEPGKSVVELSLSPKA
jgi:hypothetical protein